jgi:hypothetical protein
VDAAAGVVSMFGVSDQLSMAMNSRCRTVDAQSLLPAIRLDEACVTPERSALEAPADCHEPQLADPHVFDLQFL